MVLMPSYERRTEGFRREAHISAQYSSPLEKAWIPCSDGHCWRTRHPQGSAGQRPRQAFGLSSYRSFGRRTVSGRPESSSLTSCSMPMFAPGLVRIAGPVGSICGPARFRRLQRPLRRARSGPLRASWTASTSDDGRLYVAYAISTASGNAVARNTARRRLRAAMTALAGEFPPGDVLVRVVGPAQRCTWPVVLASVAELGRRLHVDAAVSPVAVTSGESDPPRTGCSS